MPYATPDELKSLTGCEHENAELVLQLASSTIDAYVRHSLTEAEVEEVLPGSGRPVLWVVPPGWPLDVATVVEGDAEAFEGEDFRVRADGALRRLDGEVWDEDVEITYTTGFEEDSAELLTAKRITLELAARAVANPQLLDSLGFDSTSPSFVVREGQNVLPQLTLSGLQREDLRPLIWRRRLA
ncbi:hypothetical protein [Nesterenkonia sp. PF2B19]|uniref:hypothetical protein n=1 Tax=Nesterenkonia sp. PF2B19 TaxID=1881858 RepID=UPI000872F7D4|nr:hypothetical protein [Nesterenkonia sp. PF2B19]OSM43465.1 hypothetical protein BCY76_008075 [Nesterenkonia sp. PF2B19]